MNKEKEKIEELRDKVVDIIFNRECGWSIALKEAIKDSINEILEARDKEWIEKIENMKCDYPKSSSQKEHQINIEIIERTVNQIREELLKQTK